MHVVNQVAKNCFFLDYTKKGNRYSYPARNPASTLPLVSRGLWQRV